MFNKIFSLLLCILMLTSVFVACDNASPNDEDTTVASTTLDESSSKEEYESSVDIDDTANTETTASSDALSSDTATADTESLPETTSSIEEETTRAGITIIDPPISIPEFENHDIPNDLDYNGYEFVILADNTVVNKEFDDDIHGTIMVDALLNRQEYIKEYLNINLALLLFNGGYKNEEGYASEVEAATGAGCPYDLALAHNLIPPLLAAKGLSLDLAESEFLNLYDTEHAWWSDEMLSDTIVGGRILWVSDNASWNNINNMLGIFVNLDYFGAINEGYDKNDLYDMVYNRQWTMENMFLLIQDAYEREVDHASGQTTELYGLQADGAGGRLDAWLYASGFRTTRLNANGTYQWALEEEPVVDFIDWWQERLNDDDVYKGSNELVPYYTFREDRAMFSLLPLEVLEKKPAEFNLTILPIPFTIRP